LTRSSSFAVCFVIKLANVLKSQSNKLKLHLTKNVCYGKQQLKQFLFFQPFQRKGLRSQEQHCWSESEHCMFKPHCDLCRCLTHERGCYLPRPFKSIMYSLFSIILHGVFRWMRDMSNLIVKYFCVHQSIAVHQMSIVGPLPNQWDQFCHLKETENPPGCLFCIVVARHTRLC
jgi:hypothetical protein